MKWKKGLKIIGTCVILAIAIIVSVIGYYSNKDSVDVSRIVGNELEHYNLYSTMFYTFTFREESQSADLKAYTGNNKMKVYFDFKSIEKGYEDRYKATDIYAKSTNDGVASIDSCVAPNSTSDTSGGYISLNINGEGTANINLYSKLDDHLASAISTIAATITINVYDTTEPDYTGKFNGGTYRVFYVGDTMDITYTSDSNNASVQSMNPGVVKITSQSKGKVSIKGISSGKATLVLQYTKEHGIYQTLDTMTIQVNPSSGGNNKNDDGGNNDTGGGGSTGNGSNGQVERPTLPQAAVGYDGDINLKPGESFDIPLSYIDRWDELKTDNTGVANFSYNEDGNGYVNSIRITAQSDITSNTWTDIHLSNFGNADWSGGNWSWRVNVWADTKIECPSEQIHIKIGETKTFKLENCTYYSWSSYGTVDSLGIEVENYNTLKLTGKAAGTMKINLNKYGNNKWNHGSDDNPNSETKTYNVIIDANPSISYYDSNKIELIVGQSCTRWFIPEDYASLYYHFEQWNKTSSDIVDVVFLDENNKEVDLKNIQNYAKVKNIKVTAKKAGTTELTAEARAEDGNHYGAYTDPAWQIVVKEPLKCQITTDNVKTNGWTNAEKTKFTITFNQDVDNFDKDDISLGNDIEYTFKKVNNKVYEVTVTNPESAGVGLYIKSGACTISGTDTLKNSSKLEHYNVDRIKPKVNVTKVETDNINNTYANKDSTITIEFDISDNAYLDGSTSDLIKDKNFRAFVVDGSKSNYLSSGVEFERIGTSASKRSYRATIKNIEQYEGKLNFQISSDDTSLSDLAGNTFESYDYSQDKENYKEIIIDNTPPTIEKTEFKPEISTNWVNKQVVKITASDNLTPAEKLKYTYTWYNNTTGENEETGSVNGNEEIIKNKGTGVYTLIVTVEDLAGNAVTKVLGPFNIDTEVSANEMGVVRITKNSAEGEEYIPLIPRKETSGYYVREDMVKEGTDEKGNKYKYYEGKYTKDELYIHKIDGAGREGEESGEEETKYKVYYKAEDGEYKEIAVGDKTTEDTILYNDNTYKIVVTTKDKAGNEREEIYIVHKGAGNITFNPNGSEAPVGVARTTVTLVDEETTYRSIKYKWVKEGEEETEEGYIESKGWEEYKKGVEIETPSGVSEPYDGKYELWIQTIDEEGNVNIVKSKVFNVKGKIEKEGTIEFRENSKEGEELKPDEKREIETKENVWIKITDQGEDPYGEVETTFEIKGPDGKTVGYGTKEIAVLTQEGEYEVRLTSKRVNKEKPELEVENKTIYKVTIDKTGPEVTFKDVTQEGAQRGQIEVTIKDEITGLKEDEIKYVWKRGSTKPSKEEFDGIEDNGVRGKVELKEGKATITTPENMGDVWTLWIYAKDKVGNESIVKEPNKGDNQTNEDSEAPIAGRLEITQIKENNEEEKYETEENQDGIEEGKCTKEKLRLKLKNGYDAGSGIKSNTYTIKKDGKEIEKEITEEKEIEEHGTYEITVKTEDNAGHEATRTYKITIDKKGPQIKLKPDGNSEYAKQHKVKVEITEPEEESGVQEEKTKYIWVGYDPDKIETKEEMVNKIKQYVEEKIKENTEDKNTEEKANTENEEETPTQKQITKEEYIKMLLKAEVIKELEQQGIYVEEGKAEEGVIATPEGKKGIYHLIVYGEDKLGNSTMIISEMYKIDNENPSKPEIEGSKKQIVGTKEEVVKYNGERTNKEVTVTAKNSKSQSGVDKYEVSYTKDEGKTWSNWEDATVKEDQKGEIQGKITIKDEGKTVVKFRSIAKLLDVTEEGKEAKEVELISEETEEYVVIIDKEGPKVTYENTENGENGSKESIEKIKVRPTVVDEAGVEKSTLKYSWVKFESVEEYNEFQKAEKTIEQLKEKMGEGKTFSNGEEIPSPENIEGIYSLFVYAKDKIGNESVSYSEYYAFKLGKDEKSEYVLAGEYITKVKPETKVEDFIEKVKTVVAGSTYEVYDKKGNEIEEGNIVTTASTVKVDGKTYTIIVVGDLNGDGKLTGTDLVQMRFSRVGKYELKGAYEKAADINNDGKVTGTDLVQMRLIKVGLADYEN